MTTQAQSPKVIQVSIRNVYGNDLIYPVCSQAKLLAQLAGHTTLTRADIQTIKALGYTVEVVLASPKTL